MNHKTTSRQFVGLAVIALVLFVAVAGVAWTSGATGTDGRACLFSLDGVERCLVPSLTDAPGTTAIAGIAPDPGTDPGWGRATPPPCACSGPEPCPDDYDC